MDKKTWNIALDVYDTLGDLSVEKFMRELDTLDLPREIHELLMEMKTSEDDAFQYFDQVSENMDTFLEPPIPDKLGAWSVHSLIDSGGMSSVYMAVRDDDQFHMKAAVKFIHFAGFNPQVMIRFRQEMQFLATLNHPNITRIIDSGITDYGTPWYVMEYVDGMPITRYCDENNLNLKERMKLFGDVCRAVQHAHKNLIIHRDLKPSNIFVDREGEVKLLDFGIAKALSDEPHFRSDTPLTRENQAIMTPEYASPEQLEGGSVNISSDIYSLGIILHELILGERPYDFSGMSRVQMLSTLKEEAVPRPGATFKNLEEKPSGIRASRLSREIDDILLTALRMEPERRYESVEQFGRDISNFLNDEPVMARADSRGYRFMKLVQRNKAGAALGTLSIILLIVGIGGILWQSEQTRIEAERATAVTSFIIDLFETSDPAISGQPDITVSEVLERSADRINHELRDQPATQADIMNVVGQVYRSIAKFDESREMLEASLEKNIELYGGEHSSVAAGFNELGQLYFYMSDYQTADSLHVKALDMRMSLFGDHHLQTAESKRNRAIVLTNLGDYDKAKELHYEAIETQINQLGPLSDEVSYSIHRLGYAYHRAGDYEEAENYYLDAMKMKEELFQGPHPMYAGVVNDLGMLYYHRAEFAEAEEMHRRAMEIRESLYGDSHPDVSMSLNNLGLAVRYQDRFDEAEDYFRRAIDIRRDIFGDEDIGIAFTLNNLVPIVDARGDDEEVDRIQAESLAIRRVVFGDVHPSVALMLNNIGRRMRITGRAEESFPYLEESYDIFEQTTGLSHPNALINQFNLALSHRDVGNYDDSLELMKIVKEGRGDVYGENHIYYADVLHEKGKLHHLMNNVDAAIQELLLAAEIYEEVLPDGLSELANTRVRLSWLYSDTGEKEEAEEQLLAIYTLLEADHDDHEKMSEVVQELIDFYDETGNSEERIRFEEILNSQ
jgi:eukaryotic-like serine/threonine-protein kinase